MEKEIVGQDTEFRLQGSNGKRLDLSRPVVMGILNLTPDSFYDGGKLNSPDQVLAQAQAMCAQGASILDIGACSTRPSGTYGEIGLASEAEEWQRLESVLQLVREALPDVFISIDTFRSTIALRAAALGCDMINDISGGTMDARMIGAVAETGLPYVAMHIQGTPQTMQVNPTYNNVVEEVKTFFEERLELLTKHGVKQVVLDPGFGFGKTNAHNYALLARLQEFQSFGKPLMVGFSRKSMIHRVLNITPEEALNGTTVLNTMALERGARVLRVHDVREAMEAIALWEQVKGENHNE